MKSSIIEITCPRCGHKWTEDVEELKTRQKIMYRDFNPRPGVTSFRVKCPNADAWVIVDVQEAPDE